MEEISIDSEDLIEISQFYEKEQSYKHLKDELKKARKTLKRLPNNSKNLKKMFKKTLEKLKKYRVDHNTLQEKVVDLQQALDIRNTMVE